MKFECNDCDSDVFHINGWEITEETLEREEIEDAYDESDLNKIDIVEIICNECGKSYMSVTGGLI